MKKRIIALLIVCVLLVSLVPVMPTLAYGSSSVDLPRNNVVGETVTVTADGAGCQWQVKIGEVWVNISGATSPELVLSYAMFANFPGVPVIRCVDASGNAASDEIIVNFVDAVEPATKPAPAPEVITQPVVDAVITEPNGNAPVVQQPVVQEPVVEEPAAQTPVDTAALQQALADAKTADEAAQAAAAAANAEADAKKAVLDAAQAEYDAAAVAAAAAQAALDASIVPVEEGQEPAPLDAELSAALSTAQLAATDAQAKLAAAQADYDAVAAVAAEANTAAADTAAAVAAAQAALNAAAAPAVVPASGTPKLKMASFNLAKTTGNEIATVDETTGGTETKPSSYTITVNYIFENNKLVADPYIATIPAGSGLTMTVQLPTVLGYLPHLESADDPYGATQYLLEVTDIQADRTITFVYKPTYVNYVVIHNWQNIENDGYSLHETEQKQGLTNSIVEKAAKTYEGFTALLYEKPAIAADGSTEVEVNYDRNYYLMNFDLDDGYGTEPVYARYGAPIGTVNTPTKAGYTFTGWEAPDGSIVQTKDLPTTMPATNVTYKAKWQEGETAKVTIVFWGENADDEEYSHIQSSEIHKAPGSEFTYSEDGSLVCDLEVHTHDASCGYACGQDQHGHDADCYKLICTKEVHAHNSECYKCNAENHTHGTGCYSGVGSAFSRTYNEHYVSGNESNGSIGESYIFWGLGVSGTDNKYIYINGTWYKYTGNVRIGGVATPTCGKTEGNHSHTDACIGCGKEVHSHSAYDGECYQNICTIPEHSHSASCNYSCGKTEHNHSANCYMEGAGLDSNLWTFVKSDTVKVAADGSSIVNVYYDRTEKTLTYNYSYSNRRYNKTETITAKWGSNISEEYVAIAEDANSTFWSATYDGEGPYTNYFEIMPQNNATYYNRGTGGNSGSMTYWGQDINGEEFSVKLFEVPNVGGYHVTDEDRYSFDGFTYYRGTANQQSCSGATFYYTRNKYDLIFSDGYNTVKTESVYFEAPLSTYSSFVPTAPDAYEPGSVVFGGWYLNPACSGNEYKLNEHTMPSDDVLLYAKWVPVTHTVTFYLDEPSFEAGTTLSTHKSVEVDHGEKLETLPATPTNGNYIFKGWFYQEDGVEKAFDFANMPVNEDLHVYAKWSSDTLIPYTVYFKLKDKDIDVAEPISSSGVAGSTKTFAAKTDELYAEYQEGYFPTVTSHSMYLDIDAAKMEYTFEYVQMDAVPYTVYYVSESDAGGTRTPVEIDGKIYYKVAETKTVSDNRKAVVTETFKVVAGMMPDAYQKRLILNASDPGANKIVFFYTEDSVHAYYKITHYTQNVDGKTWTEYTSTQIQGVIGTKVSADPITIKGFTFDKDNELKLNVLSGTLKAEGLELKLYYVRNEYPYRVLYLEEGTNKELLPPKNDTGLYEQNVTEQAVVTGEKTVYGIDIDYYEVDKASKSTIIRIEKDPANPEYNLIVFYYKEKEVEIKYDVEGPSGCGIITSPGETVKVITGTPNGSTAAANENFRFLGWYDEEGELLSEELKFVPAKVDGKNVEATYYAKFEYNLTTLTITKTVDKMREHGYDGFIFHVYEEGKDAPVATVAISGNDSTTIGGLTVGKTYTVVEDSSWANRYTSSCSHENGQITLAMENNVIKFTNAFFATNILNGGDSVTNRP